MPGDNDMERPSFANSMNTGTLLTIGGILASIAINYGVMTTKLDNLKETSTARNVAVDVALEKINTTIAKVPEIDYRSIANQEAIKALVARQEAQTSNLSNRLAELNNSIGSLTTSNAVILQRLDTLTPQQRTDLGNRLAANSAN